MLQNYLKTAFRNLKRRGLFSFIDILGLANISKNIEEVAYEFQENDTIKNRALTVTLGLGLNLHGEKD